MARISMAFVLALLVATTGCRGDRPDVDLGGRDLGPDLFSIMTEDGSVRMVLTDDFVYLALSDDAAEEARSGVRSAADQDGLGGAIAGFVERTVDKALGFRALYPVDEIEDVRWEDGELHVEFTTRRRRIDDAFTVGDKPVTQAFSEEAVIEFAEEFRALKREKAERGA